MAERILVIDDEKALRLLYTSALQQEGYEVDTAADAAEGINKASERDFSLAVVDIEMPGMDGLELMEKLRKISPSTRLVINSAYSTYKAEAFMLYTVDLVGVDECVYVPPHDLEHIRGLCNRHNSRRSMNALLSRLKSLSEVAKRLVVNFRDVGSRNLDCD